MRRTASLAALALVAVSLASGVGPAAAADKADGYGPVWNILPPGQSGTIDALELVTVTAGSVDRIAVEGKNAPKNFADQLEMYDRLTRKAPSKLRMSDISSLYKRETFTPGTVVREAGPKAGVKIQWDQFGVPYIHGDTLEDVAYGAGYAGTLDRMFLMDVLRHTGRAELAAFAGATESNLHMDEEQLKVGFYTEAEAEGQFDKVIKRYGKEGERLEAAADAFIAGINAGQNELCPLGLPTGPGCPAEYVALQKLPEAWTRADVVYVASLVGGIFGKGGGGEYDNAVWVQRLISKFGRKRGLAIYRDLREKNDPDAPTTATVRTPYGGDDKLHLRRPGVALPDVNGPHAPGTGSPLGRPAAKARAPGGDPVIDLPGGPVQLHLKPGGMSNALLVGGKHTKSGRPIAVMGPQTGYYTPQLWTEQVLVGPGIKTRGVAFAGTNIVNQIGRGVDYAWSATSASNDLVDTVVERLCNVDGTAPTVDSLGYRVNGACKPMQQYTHSYLALTSVTSPTPPKLYQYLVLRTRHGIVQQRTTVNAKPVAIVLQRSTYGHEVDSVVGFARWNNPKVVHDAKSFQRAGSALDFTFNWLYVDNRDIGYFSSGLLPQRSAKTDFDLPRWGDSKYEWQGWLPWRKHVRQVNPKRGYLVSWNNKTAPGFAAADGIWGYGSVYRSQALERRLRAAYAGGRKLDVPDVVAVMSGAATEDSRAKYTLPLLLKVIGSDPKTKAARALLKRWVGRGAQRVDRDRNGAYADQQAIAIFDTWWEDGGKSVAKDVLRARLGSLVDKLPKGLDDHPRLAQGSSWNEVAWYGYVNEELRDELGMHLKRKYRVDYCGRGSFQKCRSRLRASLRGAVARALAAQGVGSVAALTYDKHQDDIVSQTAGVVGIRPIDWQNRPTFQQVVAFRGHRAR